MNFLGGIPLTAGGYALAAVFFWLFIGAKEDLAAEVERCNADKLAAVAEASELARIAAEEAASERELALFNRLEAERRARAIAEEAARIAADRPERVRTIVREVADADACIDTPMPSILIDGLRD